MTTVFNRRHISETFYDTWIDVGCKYSYKVSF